MSDFANRRAFVQALGRVGRFNEKCKRFVWDKLESPVNSSTEVAHMAALRELQVTKVLKPVKQQSTTKKRPGKNEPAPAWQRSAALFFAKPIEAQIEEAKEPPDKKVVKFRPKKIEECMNTTNYETMNYESETKRL